MKTVVGLECLIQDSMRLRGRNVALLANSASVDGRFCYAWDALSALPHVQLNSIWSPQHGLFGQQQANMIESPHRVHPRLKIPIYSLYSHTRKPTPEMLEGVDLLLVDLQDVGTRVYTFAWTILACLEVAAEHGMEVWILDRPNPIGGQEIEGALLNEQFFSFVGMQPIPLRHGLTLGELALLCKRECNLDVSMQVIEMAGWDRSSFFDQTELSWLPPSPNIPRWETSLVYPGQVLLEGTNISEGRGTTRPFECAGAPFVDAELLAQRLNACDWLRGVRFRPIRFVPTFDKYVGQECGGVFWHVTDPREFRSVASTVSMLMEIRKLWPDDFRWNDPPYEYEYQKMPIDILWGNSELRLAIDGLRSEDSKSNILDSIQTVEAQSWFPFVGDCRLYA